MSAPSGTAAAEPPARVVVKFRATLAQQVEAVLPLSLELDQPGNHVRPDFFGKLGANKLKPLYPELVRQKKQGGLSEAQIIERLGRKFPARSKRAANKAGGPEISRTYVLDFPNASDAELAATIEQLSRSAEVEFVEREQARSLHFTPNDTYAVSAGTWGQAYQDLWAVHRLQAPLAWDTTVGQGVVVAVVDTGVDANHPDIAANIWVNADEIPGNGVDDDGNGFIDDVKGWDFVGASWLTPTPDNNPADVNGHGTHVAGTIGAVGNNAAGIVGIAWGARIMPLRGHDNAGNGAATLLCAAIVYAANNGADVINCSFGGPGFVQVEKDAADYAHSLGVVVVAAAGNDGVRLENFYPALLPNVIAVASSSPADARSTFSNWGSRLDVAAPGEDILSLRAAGTTPGTPINSSYTRWGGTSMAAPHASGLAALLLAQRPNLTPEQVRQIIRVSADDVDVAGVDNNVGFGRINAGTALTVPDPLEAKIFSPYDGTVVAGAIALTGVAQGIGFDSYLLEFGVGENPSSWQVVAQDTTPVSGGMLGTFEPNVLDGRHSVRLRVFDTNGFVYYDRMSLNVRYAEITAPVPPPVPNASQAFKAGAIVSIHGSARGATFSRFSIDWVRGRTPAGGWTSTGVTVANGGLNQITNGVLATIDTSSATEADWYTVRLLVENSIHTNEVRTMIYIEPQLFSTGWPQLLSPSPAEWAAFVPALDAAGNTRLFLLGGGYRLQAFAPDGSSTVDAPMQWDATFQPAAANIDGAPGDEVIVGANGHVRIIRPDLSYYTFTPAQTVNFAFSRVVVEDLNNDGSPEIILSGIGSSGAYVYAFKTNGQQLTANFPIQLADLNLTQRDDMPMRFLTVDLNGDGLKEILALDCPVWSNSVLRAYNWNGTPYPWPQPVFENAVNAMVAGDFDADGSPDIVVSHFNRYSHEYWVMLNADGSVKPGWPQTTYPYLSSGSRMAVADLDGDGRPELIASMIHKIFAFKYDGSQLSPAWPVACQTADNIAVGDVDNDGFPEVLSYRNDWLPGMQYVDSKLVAIRRDGVTVRSWRLTGRDGAGVNAWAFAPILGDFNGDGFVDIATWYGIGSSGYGLASILSPGAPHNPTGLTWPLRFHNARNTAVSFSVGGAPSVAITAPLDAASVTGVISVQAVASDNAGVLGVQFQVDGANIGAEVTTPPYSIAWNSSTVANGAHQLIAVARDADGHVTRSAISVTANNDVTAPTVTITSPTNNARIGGVYTIAATASDNVGVVGVQFRVNGTNVGTEDMVAPYSISWNSTNVPMGTHALTAVARDAAGNIRTSAVVNVTVTNVVRINFQPAAAPTYPGYFVDSGAIFASRGNGYTYGWNTNNSANVFDRNAANSADQRYDTLATMQVGGTFTWEIAVPNGRYSVHVVAGDANFFNSTYKINVEGVLTVNAAPKTNQRWKEGTSTVTISDGRITISNASGASNNKVCFVDITPVP